MSYDLVIKDGTVVDGTGLPRFRADLAVQGGRIVKIGKIAERAEKVIEAEGKIVAPGFIDLHTHFDPQSLWDPLMTSSPWHGITTVVMGNCGFTLAPCRITERDWLMGLYARVEGIQRTTLEQGIDWHWESYPEYLRYLGDKRFGINAVPLVGHSAVRRYVMGEAAGMRPASTDEIAKMRSIVREAVTVGAWGFSTSQSHSHRDWDGVPTPSRSATMDEMLTLGCTLAEFQIGCTSIAPGSAETTPDGSLAPEHRALMIQLSRRTGRPVNWQELSQSWERPEGWRLQLEFMEEAARQGARVFAVARAPRLDLTFSLRNPKEIQLLGKWSHWDEVVGRPLEARRHALQDPTVRAMLKADIEQADPGKLPYLRLSQVTLLRSATARHAAHEGQTVEAISRQTGLHPVDLVLDWSLEEDLNTEFAFIGRRNGSQEAVRQILAHPYVIPGISDGGAHMDRTSGSFYPTHLLSKQVREQGLLSLEEAVRRLAYVPAWIYGLRDRGLLQEGMAADIVVLDLERLRTLPMERWDDLPGKQSRYVTRAEGFDALVVNGQIALVNGKATGELAGRVLKSSDYR